MKNKPTGAVKTMKAVKRKTGQHYQTASAIDKKLVEIKKDIKSAIAVRTNPSLFRYSL